EDRREEAALHARQRLHFHRPELLELLGVDDRRVRCQRHRATGVAGAAAARDDRQPELDARPNQRGNLCLRVREQHDERIFDPPVGGIGDVRDAGKSIETDVVVARVTRQQTPRALTQSDRALKPAFERLHRAARRLQELTDLAVAHWVARIAPALYFAETMMERLDEQAATF